MCRVVFSFFTARREKAVQLFHFLVHGVAAQVRIVFFDFNTIGRIGFVFFGGVARCWFAFFFGFGAFKRYDHAGNFLSHDEENDKSEKEVIGVVVARQPFVMRTRS
jgi:hypothetical protein